MLDSIDKSIDRRVGRIVVRHQAGGGDRHAFVRNLFLVAAAALVAAGFAPHDLPPAMTCVEYAMTFVSLWVAWSYDGRVGTSDDPVAFDAAEKEAAFLRENLGPARKGCLVVSSAMVVALVAALPAAALGAGGVPIAHFALLAAFTALVTVAFHALGAPSPERRKVAARGAGRT